MSGVSTPVSSSSTLTAPLSPKLQDDSKESYDAVSPLTPAGIPLTSPAAYTIEALAARHSATVVVFDLAEQAGFGERTAQWTNGKSEAKLVHAQTRAGAGLSLAGRLSGGTSADGARAAGGVITAFTTPEGLAQMVPALSVLPTPSNSARLVIQVAAVSPLSTLELTPTLAPAARALASLGQDFVVLISSTAQEAIDFTALSYSLPSHVVHVFDHAGAARETVKTTFPEVSGTTLPLDEAAKAGNVELFSYAGDSNAEVALVLLNGPLASLARLLAAHTPGLGVVSVRALRPWNSEALRSVLPESVKKLHVLEELPSHSGAGPLFGDVLTSSLAGVQVRGHRLYPTRSHAFHTSVNVFAEYVAEITSLSPEISNASKYKSLAFLSTPAASSLIHLPQITAHTFLTQAGPIAARLLSTSDAFASSQGANVSRLILTPSNDTHLSNASISGIASLQQQIDCLVVADGTLLSSYNAFTFVKNGSPVLVIANGGAPEVASRLPRAAVEDIHARGIRLYTFDPDEVAARIGEASSDQSLLKTALAHLVLLRIYLGGAANSNAISTLATRLYGDRIAGVSAHTVCDAAWAGLVGVEVPALEPLAEDAAPPKELATFAFNALSLDDPAYDGRPSPNVPTLGPSSEAIKRLLFREAYTPNTPVTESNSDPCLRPDLTEERFLVTCTVNKRLTPTNYDRNVFHLEFDTSGTGLKYGIGEALGVHGWNDEAEVLEFCEWYKVDPKSAITLPVPAQPDQTHTRTAFHALQQQIDIFGRPPKSFYGALADYATERADAMALRFIAAPEGSATFKKLSEGDTVTFADVLKQFPSAHPSLNELATIVGDIKPRHYSIASAQSAVGDRVDLLVVTVDWVTPSGSPRFGQCTRYLAGLKPGQKVTVSIKPSVMKLPPDDMQPIIMAGLGTGAAPFRAFIQHRALLVSQGKQVGPLIYYFGSRHRSQEYLYGEELDAYIADGIITHAGLAFSRDTNKKVYIQHKMREDGEMLSNALAGADNGVFYLCGPTWPVPDVYATLIDSLVQYAGKSKEEAAQYLEDLKEEERYVLEVY
ncbi:sulfite reductase (NADPH) flavoprotein alpha-component [Ceratobasidium sp. AG-Ba]|nr:sulfite reductase (NADPH) flavoprotein alpha-component [Ceratobasidium sp. AG-Ba]